MLEFREANRFSILEVARTVLAYGECEGLTFVGGEPFSQARALADLVECLKESRDLGVVTYSGFTLSQIRGANDQEWSRLLACTDLLIDGEFVQEQQSNRLWRGSSNQELHFLSNRYGTHQSTIEGESHCGSMSFVGDRLEMTGIPTNQLLMELHKLGFRSTN
jgi:anaerobic ribonucleoside-triphosphate reductase activating protein